MSRTHLELNFLAALKTGATPHVVRYDKRLFDSCGDGHVV
jgi:hypothetical protein